MPPDIVRAFCSPTVERRVASRQAWRARFVAELRQKLPYGYALAADSRPTLSSTSSAASAASAKNLRTLELARHDALEVAPIADLLRAYFADTHRTVDYLALTATDGDSAEAATDIGNDLVWPEFGEALLRFRTTIDIATNSKDGGGGGGGGGGDDDGQRQPRQPKPLELNVECGVSYRRAFQVLVLDSANRVALGPVEPARVSLWLLVTAGRNLRENRVRARNNETKHSGQLAKQPSGEKQPYGRRRQRWRGKGRSQE